MPGIAHSLDGIMRAGWDKRQIVQALQGALEFNRWEADHIRARLQSMKGSP